MPWLHFNGYANLCLMLSNLDLFLSPHSSLDGYRHKRLFILRRGLGLKRNLGTDGTFPSLRETGEICEVEKRGTSRLSPHFTVPAFHHDA